MKIYIFCHIGAKRPSGGVKILFEYAQALRECGWDASILIPGAHLYPSDCPKDYKPGWFETNVPVYDDIRVVTKDDIVVMHEEGIWCYEHIALYRPRMLMINQGLTSSIMNNVGMNITYDYAKRVYDECEAVITISEAIAEGVETIFGVDKSKIYTIKNPVDEFFHPEAKENSILVMNKQPDNPAAVMLLKIIDSRYEGWQINHIRNMTLSEVAYQMSKAKIFLFLCSALGEGSSLPPVEAALSGCKVIGYTGVGSGDYFKEPLFTEIAYNDIGGFVKAIDNEVNYLKLIEPLSTHEIYQKSIAALRVERSRDNFTRIVGQVFGEIING